MNELFDWNRGPGRWVPTVLLIAVVGALVLVTLSLPGTAVSPPSDRVGSPAQDDGEFEPNDRFETATGIDAPFEAHDLAVSSDDGDFFSTDLARGDHLDVTVVFDHDVGDVDVIVYGPDRNVVTSSLSITDDEAASIQATENGTYYLLVVSSAANPTRYSIAVDRKPGDLPQDDRFEPNDGFDSATELTLPFDSDDMRILTYDRDVYAVDVADGSRLDASARFDHNESDIDLRLYDQNQEVVAASASATNGESLAVPIEAGTTYYIEVFSDDDATGAYSLSVQATSPTPTATPTATVTATPTESPRSTATAAEGPGFTALLTLVAIVGIVVGRRLTTD